MDKFGESLSKAHIVAHLRRLVAEGVLNEQKRGPHSVFYLVHPAKDSHNNTAIESGDGEGNGRPQDDPKK